MSKYGVDKERIMYGVWGELAEEGLLSLYYIITLEEPIISICNSSQELSRSSFFPFVSFLSSISSIYLSPFFFLLFLFTIIHPEFISYSIRSAVWSFHPMESILFIDIHPISAIPWDCFIHTWDNC